MLSRERSNHSYMLAPKPYVEQLVYLAGGAGVLGEAQAAALRGLRHMAEAEAVDTICATLVGMKIVPTLMAAMLAEHEGTRLEVCRLVRALAKYPEIASRMVRSKHALPAVAGERREAREEPFLVLMGEVRSRPRTWRTPTPCTFPSAHC